MKDGRSIVELAREIERQREAKKDYVADTRKMTMVATPSNRTETIINQAGHQDSRVVPATLSLDIDGIGGTYDINDHAHRQIADRLKIPGRYYERMRTDAPGLLADNVNTWFRRNPERRMVRTLDGRARAFLSNRYRRIDNDMVASAVLPELQGFNIESAEITERRFYIKAVNPALEREVGVGDVVQAGVVIQNSEIGSGAFAVSVMMYRLVCKNGMITPSALRRHHVGRRIGHDGDDARELFQDDTLRTDDRALVMKMRDTVRAAASAPEFDAVLERVRAAQAERITDVAKAVETLTNEHTLSGDESAGVLRHLIEGGDLSTWGMVNAVTRMAQDVESYDRSTELEALGGSLLLN